VYAFFKLYKKTFSLRIFSAHNRALGIVRQFYVVA